MNVKWHNRSHISYLLKSKLMIYKEGLPLHKFDIGWFAFESDFAIKNEIAISNHVRIFDLHFSEQGEELIRVACLSPIRLKRS